MTAWFLLFAAFIAYAAWSIQRVEDPKWKATFGRKQ